MKPATGGANKTQFFAICTHKATINYINDQEDSPCFLFNHFVYLDHKKVYESQSLKVKTKCYQDI